MFLMSRHWSVLIALLSAVFALLAVDVALTLHSLEKGSQAGYLQQLFNVDEEQNLPTWFSSAQLLLSAALAARFASAASGQRLLTRSAWVLLAFGMLFMSIDETAGLHEIVNEHTRGRWTDYGTWVALAGLLCVSPVLASMRYGNAALCVIAAAVFLAGAIGVERESAWFAEFNMLDTLDYRRHTWLEEGLEMTGVALLVFALLRERREHPTR